MISKLSINDQSQIISEKNEGGAVLVEGPGHEPDEAYFSVQKKKSQDEASDMTHSRTLVPSESPDNASCG